MMVCGSIRGARPLGAPTFGSAPVPCCNMHQPLPRCAVLGMSQPNRPRCPTPTTHPPGHPTLSPSSTPPPSSATACSSPRRSLPQPLRQPRGGQIEEHDSPTLASPSADALLHPHLASLARSPVAHSSKGGKSVRTVVGSRERSRGRGRRRTRRRRILPPPQLLASDWTAVGAPHPDAASDSTA
jgi:hypothetical protein